MDDISSFFEGAKKTQKKTLRTPQKDFELKPLKASDAIEDICKTKKRRFFEEESQTGKFSKQYSQYLVNMCLGTRMQTVFLASEADRLWKSLPDKAHYSFMLDSVPVTKANFWDLAKEDKVTKEKLRALGSLYGWGISETLKNLSLFSHEDLDKALELTQREGIKK
jgi:hypothetical protein